MTRVLLHELTRQYGDQRVVDHVDLAIESGHITALLGPSGCGKTTTLKMIAGLVMPTSGDIRFGDRSTVGVAAERCGAVMVFQNHLLFPYMDVAENVGFGLRMRRVGKEERRTRITEILGLVGLAGLQDRRPHQLSGGQQQRVALARALVIEPEVLLLDEPLANLDAHLREEMRRLIVHLQRELSLTTVVVTHDQEEAVVLADRIATMFDGRIEQVGTPRDFYHHPASERVARFFGWTNFVPGHKKGVAVDTDIGTLVTASDEGEDGPVVVTFRPEAVGLTGAGNGIRARVEQVTYLGTGTRLLLRAGEIVLEAHVDPGAADRRAPGDDIDVWVAPQATWVVPAAPGGVPLLPRQDRPAASHAP